MSSENKKDSNIVVDPDSGLLKKTSILPDLEKEILRNLEKEYLKERQFLLEEKEHWRTQYQQVPVSPYVTNRHCGQGNHYRANPICADCGHDVRRDAMKHKTTTEQRRKEILEMANQEAVKAAEENRCKYCSKSFIDSKNLLGDVVTVTRIGGEFWVYHVRCFTALAGEASVPEIIAKTEKEFGLASENIDQGMVAWDSVPSPADHPYKWWKKDPPIGVKGKW